jgi:SAM-dependent methyltransferase
MAGFLASFLAGLRTRYQPAPPPSAEDIRIDAICTGLLRDGMPEFVANADPLWRACLLDEVRFWYKHISTAQSWYVQFIDDIRNNRPGTLFHTFEYANLLEHISDSEIRVLDLGCGPLLTLGRNWPGRQLKITRYDALGSVYEKLLTSLSLDATPLKSITGQAERVAEQFAPNSFHFAFSRNALDHCYDPMKVIAGRYQILTDGGVILLRHFENEGLYGQYHGLHKWNFSMRADRPILWNQHRKIDIAEHLPKTASVAARRYQGEETPNPRIWIDVTIRRPLLHPNHP